MTATYDGRLRWSSKARRVDPCCMTMHEWSVLGRVYVSKQGLALRIDERKGTEMRFCPFCGARAEGAE